MLLLRKLGRELWQQKGQTLAVLAVTALGILLFVSSGGAYLDLRTSYAHTRQKLKLAELHVDVTQVSPVQLAKVRAIPGVRAVDARVIAELPGEVAQGGATSRIALRVLSLPESGQPRLDQVLILSGGLPTAPDEVLLEKHLAQADHLKRGDTIAIASGPVRRTLKVSGVGESAEYLWVARNEHDIFPSPDEFGVGWMRRGDLRALADALAGTASGLPGVVVAASSVPGNQILVDAAPESDARIASGIRSILGSAAVIRATPETKLIGTRLLQMDVDGYKEMAAFFPIFFLGVGLFIVASILARLVDAQRPVVGTLMALGVGRGRVLLHYLTFALLLGVAGSVLGVVGGAGAGSAMTHAYAADLGIPFVVTRLHWDLVGWGLLIGSGAALLGGFLPALHASRLMPAEAMRPPRPSTGVLARLTRRLQAPLALRLAVRDLLGRPLRSLGTALGVSAALVLVLTTGGLLDSMAQTFDAVFSQARHYALRVDLANPEPLASVEKRFAAIAGVTRAEALMAAPATMRAGDRSKPILLQGLATNATLLRSVDIDGRAVMPSANGVVITRALARSLHVEAGDPVQVSVETFPKVTFKVSGFADATMGDTATARLSDLEAVVHRALGLPPVATAVVLGVRPGKLAQVKRAVSALGDAAQVEDQASLRDEMNALMGLFWVMLGVMLLCAVVLAAAILFNTATLAILERRRELATLRALGRTMREITVGFTVEHALLGILGLAIGFPLAVLATKQVLSLYTSELFPMPFVYSPRTLVSTLVGIVAVLLVAQWPALRRLSRASLAEAVRVREG